MGILDWFIIVFLVVVWTVAVTGWTTSRTFSQMVRNGSFEWRGTAYAVVPTGASSAKGAAAARENDIVNEIRVAMAAGKFDAEIGRSVIRNARRNGNNR